MKKFAMLALVAALSLGVLAGCGGGGGATGTPVTVVMGKGGEMKFEPATLEFTKGQAYAVTLKNEDPAQAHSFVIPELNIKSSQVAPGKSETVSVKADKDFTFVCDVPGHKEAGMTGKGTAK